MNVILSGLTGAGKSSLSRSLAADLGYARVSGSQLRHELISGHAGTGGRDPGREYWLHSAEAIEADRRRLWDTRVDDDLDAELTRLHDHGEATVFDAWYMAWRVRRPSLRVWLEAPLDVRAERVAHDLGEASADAETRAAVADKDRRSRAFGVRAYSIDVFADRSPFGVILENARELSFQAAHDIVRALAIADRGIAVPNPADDLLLQAKAAVVRCPERLAVAVGIA